MTRSKGVSKKLRADLVLTAGGVEVMAIYRGLLDVLARLDAPPRAVGVLAWLRARRTSARVFRTNLGARERPRARGCTKHMTAARFGPELPGAPTLPDPTGDVDLGLSSLSFCPPPRTSRLCTALNSSMPCSLCCCRPEAQARSCTKAGPRCMSPISDVVEALSACFARFKRWPRLVPSLSWPPNQLQELHTEPASDASSRRARSRLVAARSWSFSGDLSQFPVGTGRFDGRFQAPDSEKVAENPFARGD